MIQQVFVTAMLGVVVSNSACSSCLSPVGDSAQGTIAAAPDQALVSTIYAPKPPAEPVAAETATKTKQVTLAISGMT